MRIAMLVSVSWLSTLAILGCAGPKSTTLAPPVAKSSPSKPLTSPEPAAVATEEPSIAAPAHVPEEPAAKVVDPLTVGSRRHSATRYSASLRIDSVAGDLGKSPSSTVLLVAKPALEECVLKANFNSLWTVKLDFQIDSSGRAIVKVDSDKPELVSCLEGIATTLRFPASADSTKIAAAIMIQDSKMADGETEDGGQYALGGGGTGWGAIGSGGGYGLPRHRYRGAPARYGAMGSRNSAKVRLGKGSFSSNKLPKEIIHRVLRRRLPRIRYCYEEALQRRPKLRGTVKAKFTIYADGKVRLVSASGVHYEVSRCVARALKAVRYPALVGRRQVVVHYPFLFSQPQSGVSGRGVRGGVPVYPPRKARVRMGKVRASKALGKNVIQREVRSALPKLRRCYEKQLAKQPRLRARMDLKFTIGADGLVSEVTASGMNPSISSCIVAAMSGLRFPKPKGGGIVKVSYPFFFTPAP